MAKNASATERTIEDIRTNPPLILNTLEAGHFLSLSTRKIQYLIKSRSLPSVKIDGSIRIRLQDLNQFLKRHLRKGVAKMTKDCTSDLRFSRPPWLIVFNFDDETLPNYSPPMWSMLSKHFRPNDSLTRERLVQLRRQFRWSRSMMGAILAAAEVYREMGGWNTVFQRTN